MPITLNHSNIGVQYNTGSNYIIETVKSDLYLRNEIVDTIVSNNLQTAPVTPSIYIENTSNVYAIESYTYSGSANTADFTRVFPKNTTCDILVVGGGGGGGYFGGGGGGGAILFANNITLGTGSYTIKVGKGGTGVSTDSQNGTNGQNSSITINSVEYIAKGGGGGGTRQSNYRGRNGNDGGSGGGSSHSSVPEYPGIGGISNKNTYSGWLSYGNNGGKGRPNTQLTEPSHGGGGGGGAGSIGSDYSNSTGGGNGGLGMDFSQYFTTSVGHNGWFGGGGGGFTYASAGNPGFGNGANGLFGGGGNGGFDGVFASYNENPAQDGLPNTGGGGGGSKFDGGTAEDYDGGDGGSGIVIIRYLLGTIPTNNLLTTEPTVISSAFTESVRTFTHSGGTEAQTSYSITVAHNTLCDILVVGGGGGGGKRGGGGGGAGALIYHKNVILNGQYIIKVGKGGLGKTGFTEVSPSTNGYGLNGSDSSISEIISGIETVCYKARGGGGGKGAGFSGFDPSLRTGGSTGGASYNGEIISLLAIDNIFNKKGVGVSNNQYVNTLTSPEGCRGNIGGTKLITSGGGGGGAGGVGMDHGLETTVNDGYGGLGLAVDITGTTVIYAGGGNGSDYEGSISQVFNPSYSTIQSRGGGGFGSDTGAAQNGLDGTGGGGGGQGNDSSAVNNAGNGGSGIVIIKFKSMTNAGILDGTTHKRLNFIYTHNYPFIQADNTNLVAWYKFDEMSVDEGYLDSNPSNIKHNLIKPSGSAPIFTSIQNISGTSATEQGTQSHLQFPTSLTNQLYTINNTNGITFSFWYLINTNTGTWGVIWEFSQYSSESTPNNNRIGFAKRENSLSTQIYMRASNVDANFESTINTIDGNWHHLTFSISSSGAWTVYMDGVNQNSTTNKKIADSTYNFSYIFKTSYNNDATLTYANVDDFRIYNKVLSSTEIATLYNINSVIKSDTYTLNFPVPTIADINNNTNIVLRGAYDIALSTSNSVIIPKEGQYIPKPTTFINYSVERMYPPVRNFTAATTTVSGQTNGNGIYIVSNSSTYPGEEPFNCFNSSFTSGGSWGGGRYTTAGVFNSTSFIVAGYLGDWLKIQLPVAIKLTRFGFLQRTNIPQRAPKDFRIYGSNDNITWVELVNKTDAVYNASYMYEQTTTEISNTYTYYGLVVNKIFVGVSNDMLNFDEWYIYGQEQLNSQLSLRYHLLNPILDPIGAQWTYSSNNTNVYHMGSVGIGTTTPEYPLDVRGTIYSSTGGYTSSTLTKWSVLSDRRIKENIVKASYDKCLENVKNIELYNFNFKDNCVNTNDRHQLGFIAQEVQQVYPKAVEVGKMIMNLEQKIDDLLTLNITQIDYTLYGAVKSLIEKIENIKIKMEHIKTTYDIT
jgi:hypothetical protein